METVELDWKTTLKALSFDPVFQKELGVSDIFSVARRCGVGIRVSHQVNRYEKKDLEVLKKAVTAVKLINSLTTVGLRDKITEQKLLETLVISLRNDTFFDLVAVFCPSYKKGLGAIGYTGKIGLWTTDMIYQYCHFYSSLVSAGIKVRATAYFSDLLLENYEKLVLTGGWYKTDLEKNFDIFSAEFKKNNEDILTKKLSEEDGITEFIDERGVKNFTDTIQDRNFKIILNRNRIFYAKELGWTEDKICERTKTLFGSYKKLGEFFNKKLVTPVMFWVESSFERGRVYSERDGSFLPVIYPKK